MPHYFARLIDDRGIAMRSPGTLIVQDTSTVSSLFLYDRVYAKGSWVLHMLRHVMGDSVFFAGMRAYVADPRLRFRTATTDDFRGVCESVYGGNLGYFFNEWVYGEGYPIYSMHWHAREGGNSKFVDVTLTQRGSSAATPLFAMPIDIKFSNALQETTATIFSAATRDSFSFALAFSPEDVQLDPENWVLRELLPTEAVLPVTYILDQNFPNPFNPGTSITFALPRRADFSLVIYDIIGRRVRTLTRGREEPGPHVAQWDGTDDSGRPVAAGVYVYRLAGESFSLTRKMLLIR
jgi:hypothetical protein